jgi:hypothetical protein
VRAGLARIRTGLVLGRLGRVRATLVLARLAGQGAIRADEFWPGGAGYGPDGPRPGCGWYGVGSYCGCS